MYFLIMFLCFDIHICSYVLSYNTVIQFRMLKLSTVYVLLTSEFLSDVFQGYKSDPSMLDEMFQKLFICSSR